MKFIQAAFSHFLVNTLWFDDVFSCRLFDWKRYYLKQLASPIRDNRRSSEVRSVHNNTQSGQSLRCPHEESFGKRLPESSLCAQSLCWFCHEAAHMSSKLKLPSLVITLLL